MVERGGASMAIVFPGAIGKNGRCGLEIMHQQSTVQLKDGLCPLERRVTKKIKEKNALRDVVRRHAGEWPVRLGEP